MKFAILAFFLILGAASGNELEAAKAEFAKQDKALNEVYAQLKAKLPAERFAEVQKDQRDWVEHREFMAEWQEKEGQPETAVDRWELAAGLTEGRIDWLKAWLKLDERKEGWGGRYSDGYNGELEIVEKDGKAWFALHVVRGPTFHVGGIGGEFRRNGMMGFYETKADGEERPTWLTFREGYDKPGKIMVEGENTSPFHGMRAYFGGTYLWTGELTAEEQKKVIEANLDE